MTKSFKTALAAAAVALPALTMLGDGAEAQTASACTGKVFVNSIYVSGSSFMNGQNRFEYSLQVQNQSAVPRSVTLTFHGHLDGVTADPPRTWTVRLTGQQQQQTLKWGTGTNNNVTLSTVGVAHDQAPGRGLYVRLTRCTPI